MTLRIVAFAALVSLIVLLPLGHAQVRPVPKVASEAPQAKGQRSVYVVRGGDSATLAQVVATHFKGELMVSALSDTLVLSGDPAAIMDAVKLLDQIDRPAKLVEIELTLIELTTKADNPEQLPAADVLAKLDELSKTGAAVQRIKLTAVEGQPVTAQTGGNKPYTSGIAGRGGPIAPGVGAQFGGGGGVQRSISYHQVGATVKASARVGVDNVVAIDLSVQDSTIKMPEMGEEAGIGSTPTFDTASLTTQINVQPGRPVVAQATRKDAKASRTVTYVIVTAKVLDPKPGK